MNVRTDSWAASLTEDQQWRVFDRAKNCAWEDAAAWAVDEYKLEKMPSRTAFFNWKKAMQKEEHPHLIEMSLIAQEQAKSIAERFNVTDEEHVKMLMSAATNATILSQNPKIAASLIESAMNIKDRSQKAQELKIEERKIAVKEEELILARRRLEAWEKMKLDAKKVAGDTKLTPEEREAKIKAIFGLN